MVSARVILSSYSRHDVNVKMRRDDANAKMKRNVVGGFIDSHPTKLASVLQQLT